MKKDKINVDELNEVIDTGNKILKLSYICMLLALIAGIIYLLRTLNIFPIIIAKYINCNFFFTIII